QLFDVKSGQRAVERRQGCGAVERIGQRVDARSGTFHQEIQVALAFDPTNADQVPQALFQIDVAELHLRFELGAFIQFGDRNRSGYEAAERLRLPNGEGQVAGTEVSRDRRTTDPGRSEGHTRRRQAEIEIDRRQILEGYRPWIPLARVGRHQMEGRDV